VIKKQEAEVLKAFENYMEITTNKTLEAEMEKNIEEILSENKIAEENTLYAEKILLILTELGEMMDSTKKIDSSKKLAKLRELEKLTHEGYEKNNRTTA